MRNTKIKQVIEKCHKLHIGFKSRGMREFVKRNGDQKKIYTFKDREIKAWEHFRIDVEIIEDTIRLFLYIKWNPRTPGKWKWNEVGILF